MHVVHIITKLELGGAQKVCLSLFEQLPSKNITTSLISGSEGALIPKVPVSNIYLLPAFKREISWGIIEELRAFYAMVRQLKKLKKEHKEIIMHTHSTKAGLIGRWASWFAGIKNRVHTVHGYGFHDHQSSFVWGVIYLLELITSFITTRYICVSEKDLKTGTRLFPNFVKKSSLIRAAAHSMPVYRPAQKTSKNSGQLFVFGSICAFKPQKNIPDLLAAFALVHAQNSQTRLEIIGDGVGRSELELLIAHHRLENAVVLHGWQENVQAFLTSWDAFVLSSLWEGLPCAVVEARFYRLPVIAYDTGGISEVIKQGKNGLLCPQKDWRTLAGAMLSIATDTALYDRLAKYKDRLTNFTVDSMVKQHVRLYQDL